MPVFLPGVDDADGGDGLGWPSLVAERVPPPQPATTTAPAKTVVMRVRMPTAKHALTREASSPTSAHAAECAVELYPDAPNSSHPCRHVPVA